MAARPDQLQFAPNATPRCAGRVPQPSHSLGLTWLPDARHALDWRGPTERPYVRWREADLNRSVLQHFEALVHRHPDRIAVSDGEVVLTFGQLWERVAALGATLSAATKRGELVGILLPPDARFPLALLACLAAGRPCVPLDPHCPAQWLEQVLADARPALLIQDGFQPPIATARSVHLTLSRSRLALTPSHSGLDLTHSPSSSAPPGWRPASLDPDEPAFIVFTSGSTGRPKGIVNSQRALLQRVAQSINATHINTHDRLLTLVTPCSIVGLRDILTGLLAGGSVHLLDAGRTGARELLNVIHTERITILFAFPALLRTLIPGEGARAPETLRLVRVGGDTTLWHDIDRLRKWLSPTALIQSVYAATEAPMMQWFVGAQDEQPAREAATAAGWTDTRVPIGYPLPGNRLAVVNEVGQPARPGEPGELVVGSPYVALGLWTEGRCVPGPFQQGERPGERVFRTGDLVRLRPDGLLERLGRKDRQIKIRGARVELEGVEAAIRQHPLVHDVGVLAREGASDGEVTLIAYVTTPTPGAPGLLHELQERMRLLPSPMRPSRFHVVPEIPRLPSSKLDVLALAALDRTHGPNERAQGPADHRDPLAKTVQHAWEKVLSVPVQGPEDDFFAAGGDSLKAIRFIRELERALGRELSLTALNEAPRFAALCDALRQRRDGGYIPLVVLREGDGAPPVFFVHGASGNITELIPLARSIRYPGALLGFQARGLARGHGPHTSVEAMATEYLASIKARQPYGPYNLCGYSFGGLVAFEIARKLREAGDEVGLLALLDTAPSRLGWPATVWFKWLLARTVRVSRALTFRVPRSLTFRVPQAIPLRVLKVATTAVLAAAKYRPGFYPGAITLFVPQERDAWRPTAEAFWRPRGSEVSVTTLAGQHLTMLSPLHAAANAALLTSALMPHCLSSAPTRQPVSAT